MIDVRKGQATPRFNRDECGARFRQSFADPSFVGAETELPRVAEIARDASHEARQSSLTRPAGPGFADPAHEMSVDWLATRDRLQRAQARQQDPASRLRLLVVCGSPRNDGTCPGEVSKTWRLAQIARTVFEAADPPVDVELLDPSRVTSEVGRHIHPCKGCVSTAMPLCHRPCSCYPNHSLNPVGDWMADIHESWVAAHGVLLMTPVHWYQSTSVLKLMIDRLACADGGNPDPTRTGGKHAAKAKVLEMKGLPYPKHLAGRACGLVVHGDVQGVLEVRRALTDWLDWMGLVDAGELARLDRFIGYYEPYATSHEALDRDEPLQGEVRNVAQALLHAATEIRAGRLAAPDRLLARARPK